MTTTTTTARTMSATERLMARVDHAAEMRRTVREWQAATAERF